MVFIFLAYFTLCNGLQFLFPRDGLDPYLLYSVTNLHPLFIRYSVYQFSPLNLFVTSTV